jgi:type IV pilus assembly protein PilF
MMRHSLSYAPKRACLRLLLLCLLSPLSLISCGQYSLWHGEKQQLKTTQAHINARLGMSAYKKGNYPLANHYMTLAITDAPQDPETLSIMAYFQQITGEATKANRYYLKALTIEPNNPQTQSNYAGFLCATNHFQQSLAYFRQAASGANYPYAAQALNKAGNCAQRIPDYPTALTFYQQAQQRDQSLMAAQLGIAEVYAAQNKRQLAIQALQAYLRDGHLKSNADAHRAFELAKDLKLHQAVQEALNQNRQLDA